MPAARPRRIAVNAFLRDLGLATGCLTERRFSTDRRPYDPGATHNVRLGREGEAVPLRGTVEASGLRLSVRLQYRIVPDAGPERFASWRVATTGYEYKLLDSLERELLVFHWQPGPTFRGPDHPHLHLSASLVARVSAIVTRELPLDRVHIPTGRITIEAVVRMLIAEFGVAPVVPDWERRLARTEAAFDRRLTDPGG